MIVKRQYEAHRGKQLNLTAPRSFNEKIQWIKLYWRDPRAVQCADKYSVREFVAKRIGKAHLIELYGVYRHVEEIDLAALPQPFVFKATHGSGWTFICKDKNTVQWAVVFNQFRKWLRTNFYYRFREWAYRDIPPRIVCEKYLAADNGEPPWDYKFFCFDGKPAIILVDVDRFTNHTRNIYDTQWNRQPFALDFPESERKIERPGALEKMLDIAARLSEGFPFVRVDLYEVGSEVFFGEMTFTPQAGLGRFHPPEYDERLGDLFHLPKAQCAE